MKNLILFMATSLMVSSAVAEITVYTDRNEDMMKELAQSFQAQTGVKATIVAKDHGEILTALSQGTASAADVVFVKDFVYMNQYEEAGLLTPFHPSVARDVAASMRSPGHLWTGVTYRARTAVYNTDLVKSSELATYEDLADSKWAGRLCMRTSNASYNQALIAMMIEEHGYIQARRIVAGWVRNLATDVFSSDRPMLTALINGECQIALVNTYYLALALSSGDAPLYASLDVHFLNQNSGEGVHTNGSTAGILAQTDNKAAAESFISFLLNEQTQRTITAAQGDFPTAKGVVSGSSVAAQWGNHYVSPIPWAVSADVLKAAKKLAAEVGWQ